jgi:cytochrome P450
MTRPVPIPDTPDLVDGLAHFVDYHLVAEILRSPHMGNGRPESKRMRGTLPVIDGQEHFDRRRIESRLFSPAALERYEREILTVQLDRFVDQCRQQTERGVPLRFDLTPVSLSWLTQVAARIAGIDGIDDDESATRLRYYVEAPIPEYAKVDEQARRELDRETDERHAEFRTVMFEPAVQRRRALIDQVREGIIAESSLPQDVLTLLMLNPDPSWDDDLIVREVLVYLSGSIRTTARSLEHLTVHLDEWFAEHPEDRPRRTDPAFLRAAAHESLRLHPVLPVLQRKALSRVQLSTGEVIEKGERVALLFGTSNRDRTVFGSDADQFDPHRASRLESTVPYGLAFALGSHTCIGRRLAMGSGHGEDDTATTGSLVTMALRLQGMGVALDASDPPVLDDATYYDEFKRLPIVVDPWLDQPVSHGHGCPGGV